MPDFIRNAYRERFDFAKIQTVFPIPNLLEVQKESYRRFLQMDLLSPEREDVGLQSVFNSVIPDHRFSRHFVAGVCGVFHRELGVQVRQIEGTGVSSGSLHRLRRNAGSRPL